MRKPTHPNKFIAPVVIATMTVLCYLGSFRGQFIFDDYDSLIANSDLHSLEIDRLQSTFGSTRQLVAYTFAANYYIDKLDSFGYHAVNLIIHLLASLSVYDLTGRLLVRSRWVRKNDNSDTRSRVTSISLFAAGIFALHPLQTNAVTYIIQRMESMAALFYLLTLITMVRSAGPNGQLRKRWMVLSTICLTAALFSKEYAISAPLVAILLDRAFVSRCWTTFFRHRWPVYVMYCVPVVLMLSMLAPKLHLTRNFSGKDIAVDLSEERQNTRMAAESDLMSEDSRSVPSIVRLVAEEAESIRAPKIKAKRGITRVEFLVSQPRVMLHYLRLYALPRDLCFDYQWQPESNLWFAAIAVVPFASACAVALGLLLKPGRISGGGEVFGLLLGYLLVHSPRSSFQVLDLAVEYRMYLPVAFLAALSAVLMDRLCYMLLKPERAKRFFFLAGGCCCVLLASQTISRNELFQSRLYVWQDCVSKSPLNARARRTVAGSLANEGRFDESLQEIRRSVELLSEPYLQQIDPGLVYRSLGDRLLQLGRLQEARLAYLQAFKLNPGLPTVYEGLARLAIANDRSDQSEHLANYAARLRGAAKGFRKEKNEGSK
ncbi:MAG: hypothetical protein AAF802_09710 [Planctomycetota bacterium]